MCRWRLVRRNDLIIWSTNQRYMQLLSTEVQRLVRHFFLTFFFVLFFFVDIIFCAKKNEIELNCGYKTNAD